MNIPPFDALVLTIPTNPNFNKISDHMIVKIIQFNCAFLETAHDLWVGKV
jgi:hypothetical protein